jgi:hypothetical protein
MMRQPVLCFLFFVVTAGCGSVDTGDADSGTGPSDHRDDGGGGSVADAGGPDATPVACDGPEDCASPDDPCLLPGTCTNDVCHFPEKDCSDLDGECTRGVCADDGECEARPIREAEACGDGIMDCGAFGACGDFGDTCDESGSQNRACNDSTCQAGACVTGAAYTDTRTCARDTDGDECGTTTTTCAPCDYSSTCDNTAPDVNCTVAEHTCGSGSCQTISTSTIGTCDRFTECNSCTTVPGGQPGRCSVNGTCSTALCQ